VAKKIGLADTCGTYSNFFGIKSENQLVSEKKTCVEDGSCPLLEKTQPPFRCLFWALTEYLVNA